MKDGNVIEVSDVYKKFKNYFDKSSSLKEKMLHRSRNKFQEYWVLKGISFEVKRGEAVGLIGCNGCGKSTTLKLLTRIIYPDQGNIEIRGRVSSLLELGAGFHPDLSGYENIYLNAAVFGLTRKEIDKRVDEIIRFSELEDFINNPIRTYSSGMYMKLAFSIAINVDADILLIDEILAVGDVNFQKKCFEKMLSIKESGTTIVIVSHSMDQIEKICDRSIWIEEGRIKYQGTPEDVHAKYLERMDEKRLFQKEKEERERKERVLKRSDEERKKLQVMQQQKEEHKEKLQQEAEKEKKLQEELIAQIAQEQQRQLKAQQEALEKRKRVEELEKEVVIKKHQDDRAAYFQSEKTRLEVVVQEKNLELERLESVIKEKLADVSRMESMLKEKENQLNQIVLEKDTEIERLEGVIRLKDTENETLRESLASLKTVNEET